MLIGGTRWDDCWGWILFCGMPQAKQKSKDKNNRQTGEDLDLLHKQDNELMVEEEAGRVHRVFPSGWPNLQ